MRRIKSTDEISDFHYGELGRFSFRRFKDFVGATYTNDEGITYCNVIEIYDAFSDNPQIATSPAFAVDWIVLINCMNNWRGLKCSIKP